MTRAIILLLAGLAQAQAAPPPATPPQTAQPAPPATDVFIVSLADPSTWSAASVTNISASPGYDNQPSFMRDSRSVLFTSNRDGRQSDIYRYWIADKKLTQLTQTAESEYSATLVPSGTFWSAIARKTNSARPSVFEANAVPIANPSGRLCTSNTPKISSERRTPAPRSPARCTSR